jgi:hypothetical protein
MEGRRCAACGRAFRLCPRVRDQKYCGDEKCRRARRRRWQEAKRQGDADYRENQGRAQRAWAGENSAYWRIYRVQHPEYAQADRERAKQQQRDRRRRAGEGSGFAKMDSTPAISFVPSGTYLLVPQDEKKFAKMDSILVKITVVSKE